MARLEGPQWTSRCFAAVVAIGLFFDAFALQSTAKREPLGDPANALFFPRLRSAIFLYVASMGAGSLVSLVAALLGLRSFLLISAASSAMLSVASLVLAYVTYLVSVSLEPLLFEECGQIHGGSGSFGGNDVTYFVDLGLRELSDAFKACRSGFQPDALTIDDCQFIAEEVDISGVRREYFIRLEEAFEARLGCTGFCIPLPSGPLFGGVQKTAISPAGDLIKPPPAPACWHPFSVAVMLAARRLERWLGLVNAPSLLVSAFAVTYPLVSKHRSSGSGYGRVPSDCDDESELLERSEPSDSSSET
eukprot:TRINITY_DN34162_c0_g1_i1.p1 TRINITY_DN34162_c0_g1~~TRINITY_DN34162_c0_g1_i1.p1  ORF type:complete len:305 (-),score=41.46 TRINITY_DN34162_c0_g1_i1:26-940(-)